MRRLQMMVKWFRMWSRPGIALALFLAWSISGGPSLSATENESAKIDPKLFQGLRYRNIGPHRGGKGAADAGGRQEAATGFDGRIRRRRSEDDRARPAA